MVLRQSTPKVWHYLNMKSRVLLVLAIISTPLLALTPAAFADETPNPAPTMSASPIDPENKEQRSEKGEKPHLGEDAPGHQRNGDEDFREHGIFHDVDALFALGGAFVLGAGLAVVILRRKKREEI